MTARPRSGPIFMTADRAPDDIHDRATALRAHIRKHGPRLGLKSTTADRAPGANLRSRTALPIIVFVCLWRRVAFCHCKLQQYRLRGTVYLVCIDRGTLAIFVAVDLSYIILLQAMCRGCQSSVLQADSTCDYVTGPSHELLSKLIDGDSTPTT